MPDLTLRSQASTTAHGAARTGIQFGTAPSRQLLTALPLLALAGVAALAWWVVLPQVELERMTDLGLVSTLPISFLIGPAVLIVTFTLAIRMRPTSELLLALITLVLILMIYGLTSILYDAPRFSITWLHAGFADLIQRTGELPSLDARFDWPLFFVVAAVVTSLAGLDNPVQLAAWVPAVVNMLYLGPLLMIFGSATTDRRLVWLAVWIFFLGNWVAQDYFSPQGFNYLLYLTILAILLRWFRPAPADRGWLDTVLGGALARIGRTLAPASLVGVDQADDASHALTGGQRASLVAVVVVVSAAVVASHQLTPFALLAGVTALVVFNRSSLRGLPMLLAVMTGTWISFMTVSFLSGHLEGLLANLGEAQNVAEANVAARLTGSVEHRMIVQGRLALTAIIWLAAAVGGIRRLRTGHWDLSFVLLALVPFGLIFLHGYGGELLLRVYFFSLPFMAFFAAAAFYPTPARAGLQRSMLIAVATSVLLVGFLFARYGNDRADMITAAEANAVDRLYDRIPAGSLIVTANYNSPVGFRRYEQFRYLRVGAGVQTGDVALIEETIRFATDRNAYLILTRAQQATAEMFYGLPRGAWEELIAALRRSPEFRVVLVNSDAIVLTLTDGGSGEATGNAPAAAVQADARQDLQSGRAPG